jgi:hypothetical protein
MIDTLQSRYLCARLNRYIFHFTLTVLTVAKNLMRAHIKTVTASAVNTALCNHGRQYQAEGELNRGK